MHREPIGECLILIGAISEHILMGALSEQFNIPYVADIKHWIGSESKALIARDVAKKHQIIAGVSGDKRYVFSSDNFEWVKRWIAETGIHATLAFAKKKRYQGRIRKLLNVKKGALKLKTSYCGNTVLVNEKTQLKLLCGILAGRFEKMHEKFLTELKQLELMEVTQPEISVH